VLVCATHLRRSVRWAASPACQLESAATLAASVVQPRLSRQAATSSSVLHWLTCLRCRPRSARLIESRRTLAMLSISCWRARAASLAAAALLFLVSPGHAQDWDSDGHGPPPTWHVDLAIHNTGLSIGNSTTFTGLRLNWRDYRLDRIHGINVTLWKPGDHVG